MLLSTSPVSQGTAKSFRGPVTWDLSRLPAQAAARPVHDPGRGLLDVALPVAPGGDCLADVYMLRAESAVFGPAASDPTVSPPIDTPVARGSRAPTALRRARAQVRVHVRRSTDDAAPDAAGQVIVVLADQPAHRRAVGA
ncbi:putative transposase [Streptomyces scabiei 87.22]|uniref:Putative transposase n=1 Tax=Streptomyces scabiei (strain 87.22) TaxID=680198 RepID=C9YYV5_STRSW|nr:putative transposase [Streptomyces scabiei 87.22]